MSDTEEYKSFKRTYYIQWHHIERVIKMIENLSLQLDIKVANVDGKKIL